MPWVSNVFRPIRRLFLYASPAFIGAFVIACSGGVDYTALAQCLKDEGVIFYGAFWCPACATQKDYFGDAASELPYVECSKPNRDDGQTEVCVRNDIRSYPTWEFAGGARIEGVLNVEQLADVTGCSLPEGTTSTS